MHVPYCKTNLRARSARGRALLAPRPRRVELAAQHLQHLRVAGCRGDRRGLDSLFYEWDRVLRPGGYVVVNDWKLHGWQGGAAADGVQARFEAIAARLGWEQKMLKRTPSSLYFCYKKPLARRELGPLLPPLK